MLLQVSLRLREDTKIIHVLRKLNELLAVQLRGSSLPFSAKFSA